MIVVGLTDIHDDTTSFASMAQDLAAADVIVLSGDITTFGDRLDASDIIRELKIYNPNIFAVPGNCDTPQIANYLHEQGISVDHTCLQLNGTAFIGIGGALPGPSRTTLESSESDFNRYLHEALALCQNPKPLVLVTHQPPYGTKADLVGPSHHVGSESIRSFIIETQPVACLCGHIHEAAGIDKLGQTWIVNPGPVARGGYAWLEITPDSVKAEIRNALR